MDIIVKKKLNIIKAFELRDLPDFLVITGENGSGKTQLLNYLHPVLPDPMMVMSDPLLHEINHNKEFAFIEVEGKKLTNISAIGVNNHQYDLGQRNSESSFNNLYGGLPLKYLSYLNLRRQGKAISTQNLSNQIRQDLKQNSRDFKINYSMQDIALFNLIYDKKINKTEGASFEECIINMSNTSASLFSTNIAFLYFQFHQRLKLGLPTEEKPWDVFNKIVETAGFRYKLKAPKYDEKSISCAIELEDLENPENTLKDINLLSSGERTIMSLLLALYNSTNSTQFPQLILFDEPDASLHPSMTQQMLDVLQDVFVKEKEVKVIMTTHSPSTVALAPESSIYRMDRVEGKLLKENKGNAIKSLTKGLSSLQIYFENRKHVFVESDIDKFFYEKTFDALQKSGYVSNELIIDFVRVGRKEQNHIAGGGSSEVKRFVNSMTNNESIYGIVDRDERNHGNNRIIVLGNRTRYCIENYIFDPVLVVIFMVCDNLHDRKRIKFSDKFTHRNIEALTEEQIQEKIDLITNLVREQFENESISEDKVSYKLINGMSLAIPKWWTENGHLLEEVLVKTFKSLNRERGGNTALKKAFIERAIVVYPEFVAKDILDTFARFL